MNIQLRVDPVKSWKNITRCFFFIIYSVSKVNTSRDFDVPINLHGIPRGLYFIIFDEVSIQSYLLIKKRCRNSCSISNVQSMAYQTYNQVSGDRRLQLNFSSFCKKDIFIFIYLYVIFFFINYEVLLENVLQENIIYLVIECVYDCKLYNQILNI